MDGIVRMVRHCKPDLILADGFAKERTVVCIVDFTVVVEGDFAEAYETKVERYRMMVQLILEFLGPGDHRVYVQPVPIGRNGVPFQQWATVCGALKVRTGNRELWVDIQHTVLESAKAMFNTWQRVNNMN